VDKKREKNKKEKKTTTEKKVYSPHTKDSIARNDIKRDS